jgi:putative oxidoreductase
VAGHGAPTRRAARLELLARDNPTHNITRLSLRCESRSGSAAIENGPATFQFRNLIMVSNAFLTAWAPRVLSILRIMSALLLLQHGTAKYLGVPYVAFFDKLQPMSLIGIAGIIELVFGTLLLLGLFSRFAAFILSGHLAVVYFMAHAPKSFYPLLNEGEVAVLFSFVFLYFVFAGPGPWSVDAARGKA